MPSVCKKQIDLNNGTIVFEFQNGNTHAIDVQQFSESIFNMAATHGFNATLTDSYAGSEGNADMAEGMFLQRLQTLQDGAWSKKRQTINKAIRVLARLFPEFDLSEVAEKWNSKSKDEQKAIMNSPQFKAEEAKILAEEAAKLQSKDMPELSL